MILHDLSVNVLFGITGVHLDETCDKEVISYSCRSCWRSSAGSPGMIRLGIPDGRGHWSVVRPTLLGLGTLGNGHASEN